MKTLRTILVALVALSLSLSLGCKDKGEEGKDDEKKAGGAVEIPTAPDTADGVVKETLKAVSEKEPGKIYYMLPDSYRKDVQDVKNSVLGKLDKETVDNGLKALGHVVAGLEKHKDKILEAGLPIPLPKEALDPGIDQIVKLWAILKAAGLDTYDGWMALDVGPFLLANGATIVKGALEVAARTEQGAMIGMVTAMATAVTVEVKKSGDEETILLVGLDKDKNEMKFVKVEGKWIPEDLQKGWKEGIANAKSDIEEGMKDYEGQKDAMKAMSSVLVVAATTFEETGDLNALMAAFDGPKPAK
ncbi:MAG: hypothetical protein ABIK09_15210 [Pseudomonadota bacterium]